jgi:hypothetical protein
VSLLQATVLALSVLCCIWCHPCHKVGNNLSYIHVAIALWVTVLLLFYEIFSCHNAVRKVTGHSLKEFYYNNGYKDASFYYFLLSVLMFKTICMWRINAVLYFKEQNLKHCIVHKNAEFYKDISPL